MDGHVRGQVLLVKTKEGTLRGSFHSMSDDGLVLTLYAVMWLPMEVPMDGLLHVRQADILSIRLLEPGTTLTTSKDNKTVRNFKFMRHVPPPVHSGRLLGNLRECDVVPNYNPLKATGNPSFRRTVQINDDTIMKLCVITEKYILVDDPEAFDNMMDQLQLESVIALEFEGITFGYWKKIGLINIATWQRTYLIDIQTLHYALFNKELKKILESENVVKVIHNCRLISAILFHDYEILLKNVFDTQVCDIYGNNQHQELPLVTRSLPDCLAFHLGLPEILIHHLYVRDGYVDVDLSSWMKRPLHLALQQDAVKNGVFLLLLHERQKPVDENVFRCGCDIYVNLVRSMKKSETYEYLPKMFMVPVDLLQVKDMTPNKSQSLI